ncbi:MAG: ATP-binding protein [Deltaproteobacteria bacterium]
MRHLLARIVRRSRRLFLELFYRRIWTKLAVMLLLAVNIPVIILCFLLIKNSRQAVKSSVLDNHSEIVGRISQEISDFIRFPQDTLISVSANIASTRLDPWSQESVLVNLVLNYPFFQRIAAVDGQGNVVASSEMEVRSLPPAFQLALKTVRTAGGYLSGVNEEERFPRLILAVPVKDKGVFAGALIADINLRFLWTIIDGITLGRTGRVFIVSDDGRLLAAQDKKRMFTGEIVSSSPDVRAALNGRRGSMDLTSGGRQWISSFSPVRGTGWAVVLRQEKSEALQFSEKMRRQSMMFLLFIEAFVIALSVVLARLLAHPLKAMVARMREVAEGNLDNKIRQRRYDEIGQLFKTFNSMTDKLKRTKAMERFSVIGQASACITHEFKNSIVALKSFVQMFPKRHADKQFVETFNKLIPEEMKRWERMLKELSELSAVDEVVKTETSVRAVIEGVIKMFTHDLSVRGIRVAFRPEVDMPIQADEGRIKQVMMNVVLNAVQAMPLGGDLEIVQTLRKDGDYSDPYLSVSVSDTGKGIPEEELGELFEPFHSRKSGSLGLGLAISRRIIENHKGSIRVQSRPDAGTCFTIRLPLK